MRDRGPRLTPALALLAAFVVLPALAGSATAQVVINEIDYDQPGPDGAEFIELKNVGPMPVDLGTFVVKLIDAAAGPGEYPPSPIPLPSVVLAPGDYFVLSDSALTVANTDFVVAFPGLDGIQNGSPDAVQLLDGPTIVDTVSYEGTTAGFTEGTGTPFVDDDVTPNVGLSRFPDGTDTDDNSVDVLRKCITPGEPNTAASTGCPTPIVVRATKTDSLTSVSGVSGDVDADGAADPGDTISYTVEIEAVNATAPAAAFDDVIDPNTTFVPGSVQVTPIALDESYDVTCNVSITVPAVSGVLANDVDPDHSTMPLTNEDLVAGGLDVTGTSGSVSLSPDGSFTFEPSAGFTGATSFAYTATDEDSLDSVETGVVTLDVGTDCIWFIDKGAPGTSVGTLADPFTSMASFNSVQGGSGAQAGDLVLLYSGTYTTGADLLASQTFVGQGVSLTGAIAAAGITLAPFSDAIPSVAGTRPLITSGDDGIDLAAGNTIRGLNLGTTSLAALSGTGVGTLTVDTVAISGTGGAVDITTGTLAVTVDSISSTSAAAGVEGIFLSGVSGTFAVTGATSFSGLADDGIEMLGGSATLDFDGSVSITTTAGGGIRASGGTIDVANSSTTVSATGGPALDISSTGLKTAGASGITFASLTSASSSTDGIKLTSLTDDLTVTGTTDIDDPSGEGIEIDSTGGSVDFSFATVDIDDSGSDGINLDGVAGSFTITSSGGGVSFSSSADDHGIIANNSGTVSISGTNPGGGDTCKNAPSTCFKITGGGTTATAAANGVTATDVNTLTLSFLEITNIGEAGNTAGDNEDAINVDDGITNFTLTDSYIHNLAAETGAFESRDAGSGFSGTVTMNFTDNVFEGNGTDHTSTDESIFIDFGTTSGATLLATVDSNTFDGVRSGPNTDVAGNAGTGAGGRNIITIKRNTIQNIDNDGIAPDVGAASGSGATTSNTQIVIGGPLPSDGNVLDAVATATYAGTCANNTGATAGCDPDEAIEVELRTDTSGAVVDVLVQNNIIKSTMASGTTDIWDNGGITVDSASAGTTTTGTMCVLIEDNTIDDTDDEGIGVGTDESITMIARVLDNSLGSNVATSGTDEGILARFRETGSDEPTLKVFFSGNESGSGAVQDWAFDNPFHDPVGAIDPVFSLACTEGAVGFCLDGTAIGSTFGSATPASTFESILDAEGNTTGGAGTNLILDTSPSDAEAVIDIIDEATVDVDATICGG